MARVIAGSSGGMKGVFVQGVLSALERAGFHAEAYAGASGSALPAFSAAVGNSAEIGLSHWMRVYEVKSQGYDMGETMLRVMAEWGEHYTHRLFEPGAARLLLTANAVITPEAAEQTQGAGYKKLGRQLLIMAARGDRAWVDTHLQLEIFDTHSPDSRLRLTPDNVAAVSYASLRMIHFAHIPAWVDNRPYVDTSYTCICPAVEMAELGFDEVIAITTEPGTFYRDIFQQEVIPAEHQGVPIQVIKPAVDLKTLGVDYLDCTPEGLIAAYRHGEEQAHVFLSQQVARH